MTAEPSVRVRVVLFAQVALHLLEVGLAKQLQVFNAAVFLVIDSDRAHLIELLVEMTKMLFQVFGGVLPLARSCILVRSVMPSARKIVSQYFEAISI